MPEQEYLGIINLAGIHEFISESRKLVELHYGSKMANEVMRQITLLLSQSSEEINSMMHELLLELKKMISIEEFIIPPVVNIGDKHYSYPNQLLFRFSGNPVTSKIENKLREFVKKYFIKKGEESLSELKEFGEFKTEWLNQWQDGLPIFFTSVKLKNDNFVEHHKRLQKQLVAHKLKRIFDNWKAGAPIPKCIQCGHREVAGPTASIESNRTFWDNRVKRLKESGKLKENEKLCAVCLGKRILALNSDQQIPTTTFMAAQPFLESLPEKLNSEKYEAKLKKWDELLNSIAKINECLPKSFSDRFKKISDPKNLKEIDFKSNAEWFYEDFYAARNFKDIHTCNDDKTFEEFLKTGRKALKEFLKQIELHPSKLIALIEYDGDKMGKRRGNLELSELKKISRTMSDFSKNAISNIFNEYNGFLIYSGGEDVLGFTPMAHALNLINKINDEFLNQLNGKSSQHFTGSGSVTFFPHDFPLQQALQISNQNIQLAKNDFERNSLVIGCVLPDSSQFTFGSKWHVSYADNPNYPIYNLLSDSIEWFKKGKNINGTDVTVSRRFLYDVLNIVKMFYEEKSGRLMTSTSDALEGEMVRLMWRHLSNTGKDDKKHLLRQECEEYVHTVKEVVLNKSNLKDIRFGLSNMEAFFKLIDFYARRVEG